MEKKLRSREKESLLRNFGFFWNVRSYTPRVSTTCLPIHGPKQNNCNRHAHKNSTFSSLLMLPYTICSQFPGVFTMLSPLPNTYPLLWNSSPLSLLRDLKTLLVSYLRDYLNKQNLINIQSSFKSSFINFRHQWWNSPKCH
jgi:hypothetical protein